VVSKIFYKKHFTSKSRGLAVQTSWIRGPIFLSNLFDSTKSQTIFISSDIYKPERVASMVEIASVQPLAEIVTLRIIHQLLGRTTYSSSP